MAKGTYRPMIKRFLLFWLTFWSLNTSAQELNCNIIINSQAAPSVDKRVFEDMKRSFQQFLNTRAWTADKFKNEERITCNMLITIKGNNGPTNFTANAQIQVARPVFGTNYETVILNYLDENFNFEYAEGQPMDFNENSYFNNITSMLAYYAYIVLGYDYDTFSKFGGKQNFVKAQMVQQNAVSQGGKGWNPMDGTNVRGSLLENMAAQLVQPFREALYIYHRQGLDVMVSTKEETHAAIINSLKKIQFVRQQRPICLVVNNFFDCKGKEIVNLLKEATPQQKQEAYNLLTELDPTGTDTYQKLIK